MKDRYCSFERVSIEFDSVDSVFDIKYDGKLCLSDCRFVMDGETVVFDTYNNDYSLDSTGMKIKCGEADIVFNLKDDKITVYTFAPMTLEAVAEGEDIIATSLGNHKFFRSSYGYPANALDDTLFDRQTDFAVTLDGEGKRIFYDFDSSCWRVSASFSESITLTLTPDLYSSLYRVNYSPINKNTTFKKPPVGWMTWYAVKFNACEKAVLDNTKWLSENLKKYGADSVWVDWEWYHKDMKGVRDDGCDVFHPDPEKYPNGLKYVADEIRKEGLIPCLWMGVCTDPGENDFIKEHPEAVLVRQKVWCGQYFFDFTHPEFLNNFLPRALGQVSEWGYEAVKMDTLPNGFLLNETNRLKAYDPSLTTRDAYRNMLKKCREILGPDRYMLSCSGIGDAVILWPCDIFEAVRIGDDVFSWESFVKYAVNRAARYYPFHNVMFFNDADNLIVREEFNTVEQAKSRAAFISLLGLPVTLGDNLPELSEERAELLRRSIPALDISSGFVNRFIPDDVVSTCLSVNTRDNSYYVVSVFNTSDSEKCVTIPLSDFGIEYSKSLAFEYFSHTFEKTDTISAILAPYETKVFALREDKGVPTIVSTSRHITQGALELEEIVYDKEKLSFVAELVENDPYTVSVYIPENYKISAYSGFEEAFVKGNVATFGITSENGGKTRFEIEFLKG